MKNYKLLKSFLRAYLMKMLLNLQMVMHEPWKASAPEVYLLRTTDGSVPRRLDLNGFTQVCRFHGHTCAQNFCIHGSTSMIIICGILDVGHRATEIAHS